jgi:IS5 family transposase
VEDLVVTPGNICDVTCFPELVEDLPGGCAVNADQIYETDAHEYLCIRKGLRPYLAVKTNRKDPERQERRKDPVYQAALYLRHLYERTFGEAKEHHGMRRCRWRGRWKTELQCLLTATVQNIKRIVKYEGISPPLHPLYAQYFS